MVEESEKMMALKKAYAEIILNTAKEAAARMMVSERKVHQLNHDLSSTKDEALRLLLRLKKTMDFKLNEAEMKSLNQQRRIEELEAQLQEAEDIVGNLRVELNDAHMKLEEMGKNQTHSKPNMEMADSVEEMTEPKKAPAEANLSSQAKGLASAANGHCMENNYSKGFGYVGVSEVGFGYVGVPEVPSIILRSKEPELYRNGCTQRIRAYEGNLLNGPFSLPEELDALKNEKTNLIEDKEGERIHIKEVKKVDKNSCKGQAIKSFRKKKKRGARYGRRIASVLKPDPSVTKEAISDLSDSQTCLPGSHDQIESLNDESKRTHSLSPSRAPSNVKEMGALPKQGDHEFPEARTHDVDEDREVASSLVLIRHQNDTGDCLDVPSSNPETEIKNVTSVNTDAKVLDTGEWFPSPPPKDRVLKYTFQRKRKKESLSDDSLSHQENPLKRKMGKKQNGSLDLLKSTAVAESSRDNRRMAQVARQLISLSEKKWWK